MKGITKSFIALLLVFSMLLSVPVVGFAAATVGNTEGLEVTSFTNKEIALKWKAASGAKKYVVERQNGDKWDSLKEVKETAYTDSSVKPGSLYNYRVRAYTTSGLKKIYGGYSNTVNISTRPDNIKDISAEVLGETKIQLKWSAASGASNYVVYQYNESTKAYDKIGTTDKTTYVVLGLKKSTKYYFRVRPYHSLKGNVYSPEYAKVSATTLVADVLDFRLDSCEETSYKIKWNKAKNVSGYEIYRYDVKQSKWVLFRDTEKTGVPLTTSYTFKNVAKNYNVLYKIRTYVKNSAGVKNYGAFSEPISAGTLPKAPEKLVGDGNSDSFVSLSWDEIDGVAGYEIFRMSPLKNGSNTGWEKIGTSTDGFYTDKTVSGSGIYKYQVRAYKGSGDDLFFGPFSIEAGVNYKPIVDKDSIYNDQLAAVGIIGYLYDPENQCFYTADDPWQRIFGFNEVYDYASSVTMMFIDTLRIKFFYNNKDWMIQYWKGQYGLVLVGAEIGLYYKDPGLSVQHYDCVKDEDRLHMEMELQKREKNSKGQYEWNRVFYRPYKAEWWSTGFVFGNEMGNSKNLRMVSRITMRDYKMLKAVTEAMDKQGLFYKVDGLDLHFTFR